MSTDRQLGVAGTPILLFNDECGVCRVIARWVARSAAATNGGPNLVVTPIGSNPAALRALNNSLDIWDAYETIHLLMPDGSMRLGGEAVAETLRRLPNTTWFAWTFSLGILGVRPFQMILNLGYQTLAAVRPVFGCESCGSPNKWFRPLTQAVRRLKRGPRSLTVSHSKPHFTGIKSP